MQNSDGKWGFDDLANHPHFWKEKALDLMMASQYLKKAEKEFYNKSEIPFSRAFFPFLMIRAFSLECLIKAIWLKNNNSIYRNGQLIGIEGRKTHRLDELALKAGLFLDEQEVYLLSRLSAIAVSHGRYPFPVRDKEFEMYTKPEGKEFRIEWKNPQDEKIFQAIRERFMKLLDFEDHVYQIFREA